MAQYDPFLRGPFPVGVKTFEFKDTSRDRKLPVEYWYPATEANKGKDLDKETQDRFLLMEGLPKMRQAAVRDADMVEGEKYPLVIFSHGFAGHRRQTTHFCTHLASHGYVVASIDHVGNTMPDIMQMVSTVQSGGKLPDVLEYVTNAATDRPKDVSFTINTILAGEAGPMIDSDRIGITGHSFGGWTTLVTIKTDDRIKAALPLAPGGAKSPLIDENNPLSKMLSLDWEREVPTLYLVAEFDTLLPLEGVTELFNDTPQPRDMVVLLNADHFHFCDGVEQTHDLFIQMGGALGGLLPKNKDGAAAAPMKGAKPSSELCPGKKAYSYLQSLGLAHMDAHLKGNGDAQAFLKGDIQALMAEKGISVDVVRG